MERAAFVVEGGEGRGTRIDCRFNPSEVVLERVGGVRPRSLSGARIGGRNAAEDPLLFTGGGETRLTLKLLFDTTSEEIPRSPWLPRVPGEPPRPRVDVRSKTRPLWDMAGGAAGDVGGDRELPRGRFIWGKAWNLPVAVLALSERLDFFDPHGTPLRSWVHIRLRKLPEPPPIIVWPDLIGLAVAAARIIAFAGAVALAARSG